MSLISRKKSIRLFVVLLVLVALCAVVVLKNFSSFKSQKGESINAFSKPGVEVFELGRRLYISNCKVCHLENGTGRAPEFPPLAGSDWAVGTPERMIAILLHGIDGKIVVNGRTFSGTMPPFKDRLSYAKIAAILTYVRNAWGNQSSPVSVEQVMRVAELTKDRKRVWNGAEELLAMEWES